MNVYFQIHERWPETRLPECRLPGCQLPRVRVFPDAKSVARDCRLQDLLSTQVWPTDHSGLVQGWEVVCRGVLGISLFENRKVCRIGQISILCFSDMKCISKILKMFYGDLHQSPSSQHLIIPNFPKCMLQFYNCQIPKFHFSS